MTFLVFLGSLVLSLILRTIVKFAYIDPATGFYTRPAFWVVLFCIFMVLSIIGLIVLTILQTSTSAKRIPLPAGRSMVFSSAFLTFSSLFGITFFAIDLADTGMYWSTGWLEPVYLLALLMLFFGSGMLTVWYRGRQESSPKNISLYLPIFWAIFALLEHFTRYLTVKVVSDQMLEIFAYVCALLFLVGQAYLLSGNIQRPRFYKMTLLFGYLTAYFSFLVVIPFLLYRVFAGPVSYTCLSISHLPLLLAVGIYALLFTKKID